MNHVALLNLTAITKSFGGVHALKGVSFDLLPGEVHAIIGENGAGKSTLIKIIAGAHQPDSGTIEICGKIVSHNDPGLARSLGVAAIYQQPALFPDLTVSENIALRLEHGGPWRFIRWAHRRRRCVELLARVGANISPDSLVRELTMPQQQLVEIAAALGGDAKILILDEPTASLSEREVDNLFRVIRELRTHGVGMIYISHRLEELAQVADRVTVLRDGTYVGTKPMKDVSRAELIRLMVGRELSAVFPKIDVPRGAVVLETVGLGCRAAGVRNISLSVRAGEILGLAGLVGAGRTELARVLFGLTPADEGQIFLSPKPNNHERRGSQSYSEEPDLSTQYPALRSTSETGVAVSPPSPTGTRVVVESPSRAVELGIAYVPEDRRRHGVILEMSVANNTTLAILQKISAGGLIDFSRETEIAGEYVQRFGIKTPSLDSPVGNLSGGNQQKVALARWLATGPCVMILDEPTQGVDVGAKAEIHRLMGELAKDGMAIILISSELPEVLGMSDRIAVMHAGRITGILNRAEATQEKLLALALGHTAEVPAT